MLSGVYATCESVAQLVEHSAFNRNCVGSNPVRLTNKMIERKRNEVILPQDVEKKFKVHNGNSYKELKIDSNHVGRKFGEFVMTKVPAKWKKHGKKH